MLDVDDVTTDEEMSETEKDMHASDLRDGYKVPPKKKVKRSVNKAKRAAKMPQRASATLSK